MLKSGDKAPAFSLPIDGDGTLSSDDLAGKPYVLYFYPKDNTPGCTTESCDFRDGYARVLSQGAQVIGVSKDSVRSHDGFKAKHGLPFPLISDAEGTLHEAYGSWGKKKNYGREYMGTIRSTFLVGPDGTVIEAWPKVRVKGHVDAVIESLEAWKG